VARIFPRPFAVSCVSLGIQPNVCPPQRPDKNAFVERYQASLQPGVLADPSAYHSSGGFVRSLSSSCTITMMNAHTRAARVRISPHAWLSRSCGTLPPIPDQVDPDCWLQSVHGHAFARRIGSDGCVEVDEEPYSIKQALAGHQVVLLVNAPEKRFEVYQQDMLIKQVPIKGLYGEVLPFDRYVTLIKEARSFGAATKADGQAFLPPASLVGLSRACNRTTSPRPAVSMTVGDLPLFGFFLSPQEMTVILYLQPRENLTETSLRDACSLRLSLSFHRWFARTQC
jgi:hypothetical protein